MSESIYLHDIPLRDAWDRFIHALESAGLWGPLGTEMIPLDQALGRVTAQAIWARRSSPGYHSAAMDGYAISARWSDMASDRDPVVINLGDPAKYVDTGDPLPSGCDCVVPIEDVEPVGPTRNGRALEAIRLRASVSPWSHVRPMGEDMVATELVLPADHTLRPVDLGAVAGCGYSEILVRRRPVVAILPTGTELVPIGSEPKEGQIVEYNSIVLAAQVESWGGRARRMPIVEDDEEQIRRAVASVAVSHDLVLINAGSSAGSEDFTARVVESLGELLVHGVAVRPGHPVILGMLDRATATLVSGSEAQVDAGTSPKVPVIGVPGYPVSAALTGEIFIEPLLSRWLGRPAHEPQTLQATLSRKIHSSMGDDEYVRVTVGKVGERIIAAPLSRGAGVITSLVRADGIVRIPAGIQGIAAGETVPVQLYRSPSEIERTIVVLGSHDLTIDLMAQFLAGRGRRLTSANVGSLGGLLALRRGEAHLAGSHLLDPETAEYNRQYIQRYLPGVAVVLVGMVDRSQCLLVPKGNPKGIRSIQDLTRKDVVFVNRQRGAGTRVLLDHLLAKLGVSPESIRGYEHEEYTHLTVAAAVASGRADVGLGIQAAAFALELDFVHVADEEYDLVIPRVYYSDAILEPLLSLLEDDEFRRAVGGLPGYGIRRMGKVLATFDGG
jgi:putative molybdopterin biosynthesis protein